MRSLALALAVLSAALLIGFLASLPPSPKPADAPAHQFSALRAMADVRAISRAPRPSGSAENLRVQAYLLARMRQLGLAAETQLGPLPERSAERLRLWGAAVAPEARIANLIGVLPGRDRNAPALLLMAHHDSVVGSPGAADDAAGVAAALEIVRALKTRGVPARDVVLLFTDAEELGLDGAKLFFGAHPLSRRVGAVVNMEARGGGGRAAMFETGRGNGRMIELYRRSVSRPSSNSLAVLVYELMPNDTDFTIPKEKGIAGFNFAFIGRSGLYHSPMATPERLDRGALQDIGAQALGVAAALAFAPGLPARAGDVVFGDVLGLFVIAYEPAFGWAVLGLSAALLAFAWVRARRRSVARPREVLGGTAVAAAFLLHAALLLRLGNLLSGANAETNYYDRLAALPRLELQAFLLCLAALLLACVARAPARRLFAAIPALLFMFADIALVGWWPLPIYVAIAAAIAAMLMPKAGIGIWCGWFGFLLPVLLMAAAVQIAAPTASPLLSWPLLAGALAAAVGAGLDPELRRMRALVPMALLAAVAAGQLLYLAHFTFLGVGAGMPVVMSLYALLVAMLVWPLVRAAAEPRLFAIGAALLVLAGVGVALSVRFDPLAPTVPPYSERR
jgi:hypothetical protein